MRAKNFKDMTGSRFGRLVVLGLHSAGSGTSTKWSCLCDCGTMKQVRRSHLLGGATTSCGCLQVSGSRERHTTHGGTYRAEYQVWSGMWQRCTNPNHAGYANYVDRRPPESWKDFGVFLADVGQRPGKGFTLERLDNSKPYGPGNCHWCTRTEQARNTSRTIWVLFGGRRMSLPDACEKAGLKYANVKTRIYRWKSVNRASDGLFDDCPAENPLAP